MPPVSPPAWPTYWKTFLESLQDRRHVLALRILWSSPELRVYHLDTMAIQSLDPSFSCAKLLCGQCLNTTGRALWGQSM